MVSLVEFLFLFLSELKKVLSGLFHPNHFLPPDLTATVLTEFSGAIQMFLVS